MIKRLFIYRRFFHMSKCVRISLITRNIANIFSTKQKHDRCNSSDVCHKKHTFILKPHRIICVQWNLHKSLQLIHIMSTVNIVTIMASIIRLPTISCGFVRYICWECLVFVRRCYCSGITQSTHPENSVWLVIWTHFWFKFCHLHEISICGLSL